MAVGVRVDGCVCGSIGSRVPQATARSGRQQGPSPSCIARAFTAGQRADLKCVPVRGWGERCERMMLAACERARAACFAVESRNRPEQEQAGRIGAGERRPGEAATPDAQSRARPSRERRAANETALATTPAGRVKRGALGNGEGWVGGGHLPPPPGGVRWSRRGERAGPPVRCPEGRGMDSEGGWGKAYSMWTGDD